MTNSNPVRPLGAQGLPLRWAQARDLRDLLSAPGTRSVADYVPPAAEANFHPVPGPATHSVLDAVPVATCYEAVSLAVRGQPVRALDLARRARDMGAAVIPAEIVAGAVAGLEGLRREILAYVSRRDGRGPFMGDLQSARQHEARAEAVEAERRALARPLLAKLTPDAVRETLYELGVRDGLRLQDAAAVRLMLHGVSDGPQAFMSAAGPFGYLATGRYHDLLDEVGHLTYGEALLERAAVPMSPKGLEGLSPEARAAWFADPSFRADPARSDTLLDFEAPPIPDRVVEVEAMVEARLGPVALGAAS